MEAHEKKRLRFRRQYLLAPGRLNVNFLHEVYPVTARCNLYAHPDLNVTIVDTKEIKLVLLGELYDFEYIYNKNEDLLRASVHSDFQLFLKNISKYVGRFVILYIKNDDVFLVTDATASRKVFYYSRENGTYCSSSPHLLAGSLRLPMTSDRSRLDFYGSREFRMLNNANAGNTTCYDGLYQLMPNHYLDYGKCRPVRFWPDKMTRILPFAEVVDSSAAIIKGYMTSISQRHKVMLPVTGGKDSRLLLAATREVREQVYYYIFNYPKLKNKAYDISIPQSLLPKLGVEFNVVVPGEYVDPDFKEVYFDNNPFANETFLPLIYWYYLNFSDYINLPGTFVNVVEDVYEVFGQKLTPEILAGFIHVERFDFAVAYFDRWLKGCQDLCRHLNFNVLNLLYWEERVANWGTQLQLDKDIAQEDVIPYNSRLLMETMLSADLKYREKPEFIIFREIARKLWPETLQKPCNPDFKTEVLKFSKMMGMMKLIKHIYYRYIH